MQQRTGKTLVGALGLALTLTLLGCSSTAGRLRAKFASEKACPRSLVSVTEAGANVYRVSGCNESTSYVCSTFANTGGELPCQEQGVVQNAPGSAPTRSPGMSNYETPPGKPY